jgi:starch synthase
MRILFLAAEAAPLVKVGGLADVVGSLPRALTAFGHDVRIAIPGYGAIDWAGLGPKWRTMFPVPRGGGDQNAEIFETAIDRVPVYLVTGPPIPKDRHIYGAGIEEDGPKFVFFSLAALWATQALDWKPDIVHAHDYHAGAAVYWLGTSGRDNAFFHDVATLFTIHNLPYAGEGAGRVLGEYGLPRSDAIFALPERFRDSLLGAALVTADHLSTVSPTYAREIQSSLGGNGLEHVLYARRERLTGILNGIDTDVWNPATDTAIAQIYDAASLEKRLANKVALQKETGLTADPKAPLLGVVSRLDSQKGFDIAGPGILRWLDLGGQFVLVGTGDPRLEREFAALEVAFPSSASVRLRFDARYARRIYAGADALLIPSRYEPCGLTQMIAMRYGAVPIARRTGGLADTIRDAGERGGTGVLFDEYNPGALGHALERALPLYSHAVEWKPMIERGMRSDFSWNRSARRYDELYRRIRAGRRP